MPRVPKKKRLTANEGEWFRKQFLAKMDECKELRAAVQTFCDIVDTNHVGHLIAQDLRGRVLCVRKR